jgi:release factor glutamine methyltransferase
MIYAEAVELTRKTLVKASFDEAKLEGELIVMHVCRTGRNELFLHPDRLISDEEEALIRSLLNRRLKHEPLSQITGSKGFMGFEFKVNEHVLTPRPDTETLVSEVINDGLNNISLLDMCTGSGCIVVSLVKMLSAVQAFACDISEEALEVARLNAKELGADVDFIKSDLYENITGRFDVIVSNPPYIRTSEIAELMPEVRDHEPRIALDGGSDGLDLYRRIVSGAADHLSANGMIYLEIGYDEARDVSRLLEDNGFKDIKVIRDYADNDRVVKGRVQ